MTITADRTEMSDENGEKFQVIAAQWPADKEKLFAVRHQVFVVEQQVPEDQEWVGDDDQFLAVLAVDQNQQPIGTGRISADGVIGRMAVLKAWRGKGVGSAILEKLFQLGVESGRQQFTLSAQLHAIPFYAARGFVAEGPVYLDAGIEHRSMKRALDVS